MADLGGVEFLIELNAKLDQAVKMTKVLTQTEAAVAKADAALKKAEKSVGIFNRALGYLKDKGGQVLKDFLGHFSALAAWDFTKGMVRKGYEMGKSLIMAAAGAEKTSRAFQNLFGKDAELLEDKADQIAKVTEFDDDRVKKTMQELGAAGLQPRQIVDAIMVGADAAARTGNESAFDSTIMAVKMMQTMNRMPPGRALQNLGLVPGAAKAIQKEIKGGTKALDAFFKVIDKTSPKPIFEAALGRGKDLDVSIEKLANLPDQFGQKLAKSEGYAKLKEAAAGLLAAFDPDSPNGKRIFTALELMLGKIGEVLKGIDTQKIAGALVAAFEVLPGLVDAAAKGIGLLIDVVKNLHSAFKAFKGTADAEQKKSVGGTVGSVLSPRGLEDELGRLLGVKEKSMKGVVMSLLTVGHVMERLGITGGQSYAAGVQASLPAVTKASVELAAVPPATVKTELKQKSPSRVFMDIGAQTAAGFALGVTGAVPQLERSMAQAFSPGALLGGAGFSAAAVAGRGEGGGPRLSADITVNIGGISGGEDAARELAQASGTAIREALATWMEQLAAQGAAS